MYEHFLFLLFCRKNLLDLPKPHQKIYLKNEDRETDNFILVLNNMNQNSINDDDLFDYHMDYFIKKFRVSHPPTKADLRKMILNYEKKNSHPLSVTILIKMVFKNCLENFV